MTMAELKQLATSVGNFKNHISLIGNNIREI